MRRCSQLGDSATLTAPATPMSPVSKSRTVRDYVKCNGPACTPGGRQRGSRPAAPGRPQADDGGTRGGTGEGGSPDGDRRAARPPPQTPAPALPPARTASPRREASAQPRPGPPPAARNHLPRVGSTAKGSLATGWVTSPPTSGAERAAPATSGGSGNGAGSRGAGQRRCGPPSAWRGSGWSPASACGFRGADFGGSCLTGSGSAPRRRGPPESG